MWVRSLGQEDPLEETTATHSRILAQKIPWKEEPGGLQSMGSQRVGHNGACTRRSERGSKVHILYSAVMSLKSFLIQENSLPTMVFLLPYPTNDIYLLKKQSSWSYGMFYILNLTFSSWQCSTFSSTLLILFKLEFRSRGLIPFSSVFFVFQLPIVLGRFYYKKFSTPTI